MRALGIDIGGSGIKGAIVDVDAGSLVTERFRVPTPQPSTPGPVMDVAARVAEEAGWGSGPIGCTFPAIVRNGVVFTAANVSDEWIGTDGAALLSARTGAPVLLLNDADAAGVAEMRFGAAKGWDDGVVVVLTFGTGIGSAVFVDGNLLPNTELGHLQLWGDSAEKMAAARVREDGEVGWETWIERVNTYLAHLELLLSPDLIVFGGGISKKADRFLGDLHTRATLVPATLRNNAGIVGAAVAAAERLGGTR